MAKKLRYDKDGVLRDGSGIGEAHDPRGVSRQLDVGDSFEDRDEKGKIRTLKVAAKTRVEGHLVVELQEVSN